MASLRLNVPPLADQMLMFLPFYSGEERRSSGQSSMRVLYICTSGRIHTHIPQLTLPPHLCGVKKEERRRKKKNHTSGFHHETRRPPPRHSVRQNEGGVTE